jgi:2,3-bisphosphoglycerate-dependent phosphoglycerate mutase
MTLSLVFETHSTTVDNERGVATGWMPGELSERGRSQAGELGRRLRECDYGRRTGMPFAELHAGRRDHLDVPYPGGESWREAVQRVGWFLNDLPRRWDGSRVLVIGHVATRSGLDHWLNGQPLEDLAEQDFGWQEGCE